MYNLHGAWSLVKAGTLLSNNTGEDLSLEAVYAPSKNCYNHLEAIVKEDEELQPKHQLPAWMKEEACSFPIVGSRFSQKANTPVFQWVCRSASAVLQLHLQLGRGRHPPVNLHIVSTGSQ